MKFRVSQKNIANGQPCEPSYCPVALAMCEALPDVYIRVGYKYINIENKEYPTPVKVVIFLSGYDRTGEGQPFEFELEI